MRLHHIGQAVSSIDRAAGELELLGFSALTEVIDDEILDVRVQFWGSEDQARIELVAPLTPDSVHWKLLERRAGPYHYGFLVDNLDASCELLRANGFRFLRQKVPAKAFQLREVAFLVGRSGLIVELVSFG